MNRGRPTTLWGKKSKSSSDFLQKNSSLSNKLTTGNILIDWVFFIPLNSIKKNTNSHNHLLGVTNEAILLSTYIPWWRFNS